MPATVVVPLTGLAGIVAEYVMTAARWYFATTVGVKLTWRLRSVAPGARVSETVSRVTKTPVSRNMSIVTVTVTVNVVGLRTRAVKVCTVFTAIWWVQWSLPRISDGQFLFGGAIETLLGEDTVGASENDLAPSGRRELWLRFAEGLGVPREEVQETAPWVETDALIQSFRSICRTGSTTNGLAALYAYESQIPAVSESKIDGLRRFYGIDDERALAYFRVHVEADKEHSAAERSLLESKLTEENAASANEAVDRVLDSLWNILSGVCTRHGIAC